MSVSEAAVQKMENTPWSSVKCLAQGVAGHLGGGRVQLCRQSLVLLSRHFSHRPCVFSVRSKRRQRFQDRHCLTACYSVLHQERQKSLGEITIMWLREEAYNNTRESHGLWGERTAVFERSPLGRFLI